MKIPLSNSPLFAVVDDEDAPLVQKYRWRLHEPAEGYRYALANVEGKRVLLHRLLTSAQGKDVVDHLDHDGLNNRRDNLRVGSHTENMWNRRVHRHSSSGVRGVGIEGGRIRASVSANGRRYRKRFKTIEEASAWAEALRNSLQTL